MSLTCIVVDDEPLVAQRVANLASDEQLQVLATCANADEAIAAIMKMEPKIVFLDIQMPGKSGLDVIQKLSEFDDPPVCIMVTAFDQYAAAAFTLAAVDYVLKPVSRERFGRAVARARLTISQQEAAKQIERLRNALIGTKQDSIFLQDGGRIFQFVPADVSRVQAADDYCLLYENGNEHLVPISLIALEKMLPTPPFVRCHRSHLVNLGHFEFFEPNSSGGGTLKLADACVPVSRTRLSEVKALIQSWKPSGIPLGP